MMMSLFAVNRSEKLAWQRAKWHCSSVLLSSTILVLLCVLLGGAPAVSGLESSTPLRLLCVLLGGAPSGSGLEMEPVQGGCLQVTLEAGDHIKAGPRCIVSRGAGLALRPPATLDSRGGILKGLKRRLRGAHGRENRRDNKNSLQRLSNTMASNVTDCYLAPPFPGDIALVSVSSSGETEGDSESRSAASPSPSSSGQSGRAHTAKGRREPPTQDRGSGRAAATAVPGPAARKQKKKRNRPSATGYDDNSEKPPRRLVLLTQAIVAVGPEVIVKPMPSEDRGGGGSPLSRQQRGGAMARMGALSVCEGQGPVALAGYGKLRKLRLRPGQKRLVDTSRAVAWTSGVMCLAGPGERAPRSSSGSSSRSSGVASPSAVSTFVGPGTVYVQTHSLSGLRRLLLPKPGLGGSIHGGSVSSGFLGVGGRGTAAPAPRRGAVVGLSLKRGLAKRAKAAVKKVSLALAFFALYLVVYSLATALLLEGRDGLVKAPRHAVQVVRSLIKVARRVAMVLIRLGREELWRKEEGGAGVVLPQESPLER